MTIPANSPMCQMQLWRSSLHVFDVLKTVKLPNLHISIRVQAEELEIGYKSAKPVIDWIEYQCQLQNIDVDTFSSKVERGFIQDSLNFFSTGQDDMFIYSAELPLPLANMMKLRWHGVEGFQVLIL